MPTKLDQSQVDGLPEEIQSLDSIDVSLEVKISTEDSQNDQVDVNLQGQIDDLKSTVFFNTSRNHFLQVLASIKRPQLLKVQVCMALPI